MKKYKIIEMVNGHGEKEFRIKRECFSFFGLFRFMRELVDMTNLKK